MTGHAHMRAGHENIEKKLSPIAEERPEVLLLLIRQHGEPRQRIAFVSADGGRQSPHTAASVAQLGQFFLGEFDQPVRRVGAHRMNAPRRTTAQPIEAIRMENPIQTPAIYHTSRALVFRL